MNKKIDEKLTLTNYNNEFLFKKNTSNLNISFNRVAFIFFIFFIVSFDFFEFSPFKSGDISIVGIKFFFIYLNGFSVTID